MCPPLDSQGGGGLSQLSPNQLLGGGAGGTRLRSGEPAVGGEEGGGWPPGGGVQEDAVRSKCPRGSGWEVRRRARDPGTPKGSPETGRLLPAPPAPAAGSGKTSRGCGWFGGAGGPPRGAAGGVFREPAGARGSGSSLSPQLTS